jgi:hypothetical protein
MEEEQTLAAGHGLLEVPRATFLKVILMTLKLPQTLVTIGVGLMFSFRIAHQILSTPRGQALQVAPRPVREMSPSILSLSTKNKSDKGTCDREFDCE